MDNLRGDLSHLVNLELRHALVRTIVALGITVEQVVEVGRETEVVGKLPLRHHVNGEVGVLGLVLVVAGAILQDGEGVGQRLVAQRVGRSLAAGQDVVVAAEQAGKLANGGVILVGSHQRRLDEGQGRGRRDGTGREVGGEAIVVHITISTRDGDVETGGEVPQDLDVGVETHVHAVEAALLQRVLRVDIAHGEVVHAHIVATLHVDAVVLRQRVAIDLVGPVGVVVVGVVVVAVGIVVEEVEVLILLDVGNGAQQLGSIGAILRGIHHRGQLGDELHAGRYVGIDAGGHGLATLGVDEHHAIGTTGAIEGGGVLEHRHLLNVVGRDAGQDVVELAAVKRAAVALHVLLNAVDDNERLGIAGDAVQTTDEHRGTALGCCRAHDAVHVATQLVGNLGINGHAEAIDVYRLLRGIGSALAIHGLELVAEHLDCDELLLVASHDGHLL